MFLMIEMNISIARYHYSSINSTFDKGKDNLMQDKIKYEKSMFRYATVFKLVIMLN